MTTLDERIARHRELSQKRAEIDQELHVLADELQTDLKSLLGGLTTTKPEKPTSKPKSVRKCGTCGADGHNAKTCPSAQGVNGADRKRTGSTLPGA